MSWAVGNELIPWSPSYQLGRYFGERFRQEYDDIDQARLALSISATENADEVELEKGFLDGWQAPLVTPSGVADTTATGSILSGLRRKIQP